MRAEEQPSRWRLIQLQGKTYKSVWPRQRATLRAGFSDAGLQKNSRAGPSSANRARPGRKAGRLPTPATSMVVVTTSCSAASLVVVRHAPLSGDPTPALAKPDRSKAVAPARRAEDDFVSVL